MPPSKVNESSIAALMELGVSKSKAQKTLKDCNNNLQQAKKMIANQQEKLLVEQRRAEKESKFQEKKAEREWLRSQGFLDTSEDEDDDSWMMQTHPCLVQYKSCKYGRYCHFKDLPGDTCINYLLGTCIYGSSCKNRHFLQGVDLRKAVNEARDAPIVVEDSYGNTFSVDHVRQSGKVLEAKRVERSSELDVSHLPTPTPQEGDYYGADASMPTYSEPLQPQLEGHATAMPMPSPFLDMARKKTTGVGHTPSIGVVRAPAPTSSCAKTIKTHPCIKQFGECKYGTSCLHYNQPEDVCVHYLNNRCRCAKGECPWRHERNADLNVVAARRVQQPKKEGVWSELAPVTDEAVRQMYTRRPFPTSEPSEVTDVDVYEPSENEEKTFLSLIEMFPTRDAAEVILVLRYHRGNGSAAAAALMNTPPDLVGVGDWGESEEEVGDAEAQTEQLLTLCTLFPSLDIKDIEASYNKASRSFDSTYIQLQRRVLGLPRMDGSRRSVMSAADTLKMDKLKALFPELRADVIEEAYAQIDGTMPTIIAALQQLKGDSADTTAEDLVEADKLRSSHNIARSAARQRLGIKPADTDSFVVSAPLSEPSTPLLSETSLYQRVVAQASGLDDWRRLRQEALLVNRARIACFADAAVAYHQGKGDVAHRLSREGRRLGIAYSRLNILAMHAREQELDRNIQSLDLHGFYVQEALDVLYRRLRLCSQHGIRLLRVVTGRGLHSKSGSSVLFAEISEAMSHREPFMSMAEITSVRPAYLDLTLKS